jgi:hypothetical protein
MKKFILSAILLAGFSFANAQSGSGELKFSGGAEAALPIGDFGNFSSFGIGGFAAGDYGLSESFHLIGSLGYNAFFAKGGLGGSLGTLTFRAGGAYYASEAFNVNGAVGFGSLSGGGGSVSGFHYSAGVGYNMESLGFGLNYNAISANGGTNTWLGLRVAYSFSK